MSEKESTAVTVRILDKEYFVGCPPDERPALLDSAEYLTKKMREIRDTGKVVGTDRIAVMAALNMANDLAKLQVREERSSRDMGTRVRQMSERVERALVQGQQLEL